MIVGHIGARKGSKGVPGKNFRTLQGKPLIDWSLDQLLDNPRIDVVVVSTDDEDIYRHARAKNTLDIGLRPPELCTDTAPKWLVWQHALKVTEAIVGPISVFVDLDCTAPMRRDGDIDAALAQFAADKPDMLMSCCTARKNPYFNLVEPDATGALQVSKPLATHVVARQQAPVVYEHAGGTYVLDPTYLKSASSLFEGRVLPFLMPAERCVDIDSEFDFKIANFLMKERNSNQPA
ncbi:acylneuraminate cytidylyltransferase family protein [Paracoccaceae bacterium]|jgi:CMP-N,N'-diacetyllegionaminic acid synthase|nr:acylneuraminate cytidylyltransferase family protein [Paracoccaceae bacterium]